MDDINIAKTDWRNENHMIRVHCPTNGNVRDIQITVDDKLISLGENVSYSQDRNDVLFPLKKTYAHRDISELVDIMKQMDRKLVLIGEVMQDQQKMTDEQLSTMTARIYEIWERPNKWMSFLVKICTVILVVAIAAYFIYEYKLLDF
jgi:hypothetical protein